MALSTIILETLEHYKNANLSSEIARIKIKNEIVTKFLEEYNQQLINAELELRSWASKILKTMPEDPKPENEEPLLVELPRVSREYNDAS